jgi:4,5-DOPA dioxygenase extradiol
MAARIPTVFIGHGNPMRALVLDDVTSKWAEIGRALPRPEAILCISAHWFGPGIRVTAQLNPPTIHDFAGFPAELSEVQYPAMGDPATAARVIEALAPAAAVADTSWGLDHGTWSVLVHMFPDADIPVIQLSIDSTLSFEEHLDLGRRLSPLRDEGILVLGSGNIVHNLSLADFGGDRVARPECERFDDAITNAVITHSDEDLFDLSRYGHDASISVPTAEHYAPLLYAVGASSGDAASVAVDGIEAGTLSMTSYVFG